MLLSPLPLVNDLLGSPLVVFLQLPCDVGLGLDARRRRVEVVIERLMKLVVGVVCIIATISFR
jgi:hypothetical protein